VDITPRYRPMSAGAIAPETRSAMWKKGGAAAPPSGWKDGEAAATAAGAPVRELASDV